MANIFHSEGFAIKAVHENHDSLEGSGLIPENKQKNR